MMYFQMILNFSLHRNRLYLIISDSLSHQLSDTELEPWILLYEGTGMATVRSNITVQSGCSSTKIFSLAMRSQFAKTSIETTLF